MRASYRTIRRANAGSAPRRWAATSSRPVSAFPGSATGGAPASDALAAAHEAVEAGLLVEADGLLAFRRGLVRTAPHETRDGGATLTARGAGDHLPTQPRPTDLLPAMGAGLAHPLVDRRVVV